ncbi:hypothetical protein M5K25_000824 [Dendrobium thyrsiflorum]|uniref:Uncharacterized protein n=1 Tax=Dendrobium thyrsiflorum TaxID=117978 RepID=A0ABD0VUS7_DENTH
MRKKKRRNYSVRTPDGRTVRREILRGLFSSAKYDLCVLGEITESSSRASLKLHRRASLIVSLRLDAVGIAVVLLMSIY